MGKTPAPLRRTIAKNIRDLRIRKFPGRGGAKKCAEAFGVSPQQWSPWERGVRTPDELRLDQIASFFAVTVDYLRHDNRPVAGAPSSLPAPHLAPPVLADPDIVPDIDLDMSVPELLFSMLKHNVSAVFEVEVKIRNVRFASANQQK